MYTALQRMYDRGAGTGKQLAKTATKIKNPDTDKGKREKGVLKAVMSLKPMLNYRVGTQISLMNNTFIDISTGSYPIRLRYTCGIAGLLSGADESCVVILSSCRYWLSRTNEWTDCTAADILATPPGKSSPPMPNPIVQLSGVTLEKGESAAIYFDFKVNNPSLLLKDQDPQVGIPFDVSATAAATESWIFPNGINIDLQESVLQVSESHDKSTD